MTVGLASRDGEVTRQRRSGRSDHHEIAFGEVLGSADDPARLTGSDVDLTPPDWLLELGEFLDFPHVTDHDRSLEASADGVDGFDLESGRNQALGNIAS